MTQAIKGTRKPRIGLMGEFSAGKSTLCNFLLGQNALPEKVIATRVPPVWMTEGDQCPMQVLHNGQEAPISFDHLEQTPFEETRFIRLQLQADILKKFDLIDLPGISDPNMSSEVWETMIEEIDAILWCTHATQSWRQSEAGVWDTIPDHIRRNSLLLVTKFDKISSERDRQRVLLRIEHEAGDKFDSIVPLSLLQAMRAEKASDEWIASGADIFLQKLNEISNRVHESGEEGLQIAETPSQVETTAVREDVSSHLKEVESLTPDIPANPPQRIVPKRVRPRGDSMTERPKGKATHNELLRNLSKIDEESAGDPGELRTII